MSIKSEQIHVLLRDWEAEFDLIGGNNAESAGHDCFTKVVFFGRMFGRTFGRTKECHDFDGELGPLQDMVRWTIICSCIVRCLYSVIFSWTYLFVATARLYFIILVEVLFVKSMV
jgi:hypothetical protein